MMRAGPNVGYPVLLQLALESRRTPPVHILTPVVRQHLLGHPILPNSTPIHLQHVLRRLAPIQTQSRDVPRVIVDKPDRIRRMPAQPKREYVTLPHLVRSRPLEKPGRLDAPFRFLLRRLHETLVVQGFPYSLGTGPQKE